LVALQPEDIDGKLRWPLIEGMRMLSVMIIFVGLLFIAVRHADLPIGRVLHSAFIAMPASWLTRTPPQRIAIVLMLLIGAFLAWEELGPMLMAADYSPILWIADMSIYLDAILTVTVVATVLQVKSVGRLTSALVRAPFVRARARARSSNFRQAKRPSTDEDAPNFAICVAA
jgi:hypothetical protein